MSDPADGSGPADTVRSVNPATGRMITEHRLWDNRRIDVAIDLAWERWQDWRLRPVVDRVHELSSVADAITARRRDLARMMTAEMGKPISAALTEVDKTAAAVRFILASAPETLADDCRPVDPAPAGSSATVRFSPLGPIFGIMPWNFPYWQTVRLIVPAWVAGNVTLVKPAPETLGSAALFQEVLDSAGLPPGLMQTVPVPVSAVERIVSDPRIRGVSLTGSSRAGRSVAALAGRHLTKVVLELGGSDPFIVLADADVEAAAAAAVASRMQNAGQSCIAAKRFLVHADVAGAFVEAFVDGVRSIVVGDPTDPAVTLGPLATAAARDLLHAQVTASVAEGARVEVGGAAVAGPGFFYQPTLLSGVTAAMRCAQEEVFGPAAAMSTFTDTAAAVRTANASPYGLAATIWTRDRVAAEAIATGLDVGQVFVNAIVASDPRYPFGGVKDSGFGRELGVEGFREFTNVKLLRFAA